jgi:phenylacetate-CoA ligase
MRNTWFTKKAMNIYVLMDLIKGGYILSKAEKKPAYWNIAQTKSIQKFVKHIYKIPFYRDRFNAANIGIDEIKSGEDFLKLPILTKEEYKSWILKETANREKYKNWLKGHTTGSTGMPLDLYYLPTDRAAEIANLFRCALIQGKDYHVFTDRIFSTMTSKPKKQKKISIPYNKQMSSLSAPEDLVTGYNNAKPDFYYGNKTAILMIATHALDNNIPLWKPKCVGSTSEILDRNARKIIEEAFGKEILFDIYGCAECGNFAVEKIGADGGHIIWNDTHVVNLVNEREVKNKPGYKIGELAITSLIHYGFPMVNYLLGDTVEIKEVNGVKYITRILGRTNDTIKNRDGSSFSWLHIYRVMSDITDIMQFRVIQKSYEKLLFVLAAKGLNNQRMIEIEKTILERILLWGGPTKINFEWCERINPDSTGKIRMVISEVD